MKENSAKLHCGTVIGFSLMAVLNAAIFVFTFALIPLIICIVCAAVTVIELCTRKFPLYAGVALLGVSVYLLNIPGPVFPGSEWQYSCQRTYIQWSGRDNLDFFPDKLPENTEGYTMSYKSIFEDVRSEFMISFKTDTDTAAQLAENAKAQEILTAKLSDFVNDTDGFRRKIEIITASRTRPLPLSLPEAYTNAPDGYTLYVIYSSFEHTNPRTGAVLINIESGDVLYIQQG